MPGARDRGLLLAELALTTASCGAIAWLDGLRVARGGHPSVPWSETAGLAARGGRYLLAAAVTTLALAWLATGVSARRGGTARSPLELSIRVLVGWVAACLVLVAAGFDTKIGWLATSLLVGLLAGWLAARFRRKRAPREVRAGPLSALIVPSVVLWGSMWLIPAVVPPPRSGSAVPAPAAPRPNFLLVVIDALRADHL